MIRKLGLPATLLVAAATALALLPFATPSQAVTDTDTKATPVKSGWSWTDYGPELLSVSCSAPGTCVAVGVDGAVLRSPNTGPDAAQVPLAWSFVALRPDPKVPDKAVALVAVSCSATSCLAVSGEPDPPTVSYVSSVYRSTDNGATWTEVQQLPATGTRKATLGQGIACAPDPSATADTRVCYVVGVTGGIWRSTNDGQSWAGVSLPPAGAATAAFDKIVCPSADLCVAAGGNGSPSSALIRGTTVTMLTTPAGIDEKFAALACDPAAHCVAAGKEVGYTVMTLDANPAWGPVQSFRKDPKDKAGAVVLVCPIANTCVGLDGSGNGLHTETLTTPGVQWRRIPAPPVIEALSCLAKACVGVGKSAAWYVSSDLGYNFERVNEVAKFDVAVCDSRFSPACIAGGEQNIGRSITGGTLWTLPIASRGALNTKAIRCQSSTQCEVFGQTEVLVTEDMNVWRPRFGPVQAAQGSEAQFCVTDTLCVAANESVVFTTFDGGRTQWSSNQLPDVRPSGISCLPGKTDPVTCFIAVKTNILIGRMTQGADLLPRWQWLNTNVDADNIINAISCSPDGNCVAVGVEGEILATRGGDLMNWEQMTIPPTAPVGKQLPAYTAVSCPSAGFCMVGGVSGESGVVTSTLDGFATYSYDLISKPGTTPIIKGFGCESVNRCIVVGSTVLLGLRNPPVTPPAP